MSTEPVVILMKGLPSCGKSTQARRLAGEAGVVCETDAFFREERSLPSTVRHDWQWLRARSRRWNRQQFMQAIQGRRSPIVVDRGCGADRQSYFYVRLALQRGYRVELAEPDSPWWPEVRQLLEDPEANAEELDRWAHRLAEMNAYTNHTKADSICQGMRLWSPNLTVDQILAAGDEPSTLAATHFQSSGVTRNEGKQVVYLMRGLPSCGKSDRARRLAGLQGKVCETDAFYRTQEAELLRRAGQNHLALKARAQNWSFDQFQSVVAQGITPIVVDRGNALGPVTRKYVSLAQEYGYRVELAEPDSPWWLEIRELLRRKSEHAAQLDAWAERLADMNQDTHGTTASKIRKVIDAWIPDLTVDQITAFDPESSNAPTRRSEPCPIS